MDLIPKPPDFFLSAGGAEMFSRDPLLSLLTCFEGGGLLHLDAPSSVSGLWSCSVTGTCASLGVKVESIFFCKTNGCFLEREGETEFIGFAFIELLVCVERASSSFLFNKRASVDSLIAAFDMFLYLSRTATHLLIKSMATSLTSSSNPSTWLGCKKDLSKSYRK